MAKRSYLTTRFAVMVLVVGMACTGEQELASSTTQVQQSSRIDQLPDQVRAMLAFQDEMRKLWEDHIVWTRGFIISVAHSLPDTGPTAQRLLANQVDIGNAFRRFYG